MKTNSNVVRGRHPAWKTDELAAVLACCRRTVERWCQDGKIRAVRIGNGPYRIPAVEVDRILGTAERSDGVPIAGAMS